MLCQGVLSVLNDFEQEDTTIAASNKVQDLTKLQGCACTLRKIPLFFKDSGSSKHFTWAVYIPNLALLP